MGPPTPDTLAAASAVLAFEHALLVDDFLPLAFRIERYVLCIDEGAAACTRRVAGRLSERGGGSEARKLNVVVFCVARRVGRLGRCGVGGNVTETPPDEFLTRGGPLAVLGGFLVELDGFCIGEFEVAGVGLGAVWVALGTVGRARDGRGEGGVLC